MGATITPGPGDPAPKFSLPDQGGNDLNIEDLRGKWVVLYFYPKDNTPGCTTEALEFTEHLSEFHDLGAVVLGVSPDSEKSHRNFIAKKNLKVTLLSDGEKKVVNLYGVWQKKKMAGREYMGVVRSTFLIDPGGRIARSWPKVKVKGHVREVKETLQAML